MSERKEVLKRRRGDLLIELAEINKELTSIGDWNEVVSWVKDELDKNEDWVNETFRFSTWDEESKIFTDPDFVLITENLYLSNSPKLKHFPKNLWVDGDMDLRNCESLVKLPTTLFVNKKLDLEGCTNLKDFSGITSCHNLSLKGCTNLEKLPDDLSVEETLNLSGCTFLKELPNDLKLCEGVLTGLSKSVILSNCTSLEKLPYSLEADFLYLDGCTNLKNLPNGLNIREIIYLSYSQKELIADCKKLGFDYEINAE